MVCCVTATFLRIVHFALLRNIASVGGDHVTRYTCHQYRNDYLLCQRLRRTESYDRLVYDKVSLSVVLPLTLLCIATDHILAA